MVAGIGWLTQLSVGSGYAASLLGPMILMGVGAGLAFHAAQRHHHGQRPGRGRTAPRVGACRPAAGCGRLGWRSWSPSPVRPLGRRRGRRRRTAVAGGRMTAAFVAAALVGVLSFVVALTFRREARTS